MVDWKNQQDIKKILDDELSGIVADENKFENIVNLANVAQFDERKKVKNKGYKSVIKVALIVAAISLSSVVTVLAVINSRYNQQTVGKIVDHFENVSENAPVYEVNNSKTGEDSELESGNIVAEWGQYTTNGNELFVNVTFKSADGTPIVTEDVNRVPDMLSLSPEKIYVTLDGETKCFIDGAGVGEDDSTAVFGVLKDGVPSWDGVYCMWYATSYSDDLSSITLEINYNNYDVELYGKDIKFELENVNIKYSNYEDICGEITVANLLADKQAGKDKIYFSEKYPECYIEDFGMDDDDSYGKNAFYITFAGEKVTEALKDLCMQSTITGLSSGAYITELENGKMLMTYQATRDKAYDDIADGGKNPFDTEWAHLENVILKNSLSFENVSLAGGKYEVTFAIDAEENSSESEEEVVVKSLNTGEELTITKINVNNLTVDMEVKFDSDFAFEKFGTQKQEYRVVCVMKDGSQSVLNFNGGGCNVNSGVGTYSYMFSSPVNVDDIDKLLWHEVVIWE